MLHGHLLHDDAFACTRSKLPRIRPPLIEPPQACSGFGYGVDWNGHGPPSWCPDGWQWYGRDIGWAPYRGWQPPHNWQPSVIIIRIFIKISWWCKSRSSSSPSPPSYACNYWCNHWDRDYYRYGIPQPPRNYPGGGRGGWYSKGGGYYWRFHGRGGHKRDEVDGAALG
ncbi:hypothetical protein JCM8097_004451 [Rhodosporidiobolus ruineniae]